MTDTAHGVTQQSLDTTSRLPRSAKIRLISGKDFWNSEGLDSAGIASFMLTDGPHGLRKQAGDADNLGVADSVPATCCPTASALGSTWDMPLLEEVGAEYAVHEVPIAKGANTEAAYLDINPKARVPALMTPNGVITENPAILTYIAAIHPQGL